MTNKAYQELLKRHYALYDTMIKNMFEEIELMTCLFGEKTALSTIDVDYTWKELLEHIKDTYQTHCEERKEKISEEEKTVEHNEWVPRSERLPDKRGFYLCTTEGGEEILEFNFGNPHYKDEPSFVSDFLGRCNPYVVAWMPLPKPYKENK